MTGNRKNRRAHFITGAGERQVNSGTAVFVKPPTTDDLRAADPAPGLAVFLFALAAAAISNARHLREIAMKRSILLALLVVTPVAAHADDSATMHAKMQALMDSVALGDKAPWIATLDKRFVQIDENGVGYDYGQSIAQVAPLPKGASGDIKVVEWKATVFGDSAVSTHLDDEHENFHGQKLHALYRSIGTWLKEDGDWKLVAMQTIALRQDPPAVPLPAKTAGEYAGTYRAGPDYTYTITQSGGRLYGATNGNKPVEIKAELADVLFTPGQPRTRKIFQRDAQGKVTGFLSRREERDVVFTKEK